jgi:hypothetical protein
VGGGLLARVGSFGAVSPLWEERQPGSIAASTKAADNEHPGLQPFKRNKGMIDAYGLYWSLKDDESLGKAGTSAVE